MVGLGYWDTRQALDRKYSLEAQQLEIQKQATAALAGLQGAQANETTVRAGLAPQLAASDIAFKGANTQTVLAELPFVAPRAQADIGAVRAGIGLTDANAAGQRERNRFIAPLAQTEIGLGRANIGRIGADTRATNRLGALSPVSSSQIGGFMSRILQPEAYRPSWNIGVGFP